MIRLAKSLKTILWIGLIAGTLDITENIIFNAFRGISPWRIFQFIASGLIDGRSFQLEWTSVGLRVVIHYAIALTWTAIFYIASTRFNFVLLWRRPVPSGLLYGVLVYAIMNFVVLPLSAVPSRPSAAIIAARVNAMLALMFCIGLPVALLVKRAREVQAT